MKRLLDRYGDTEVIFHGDGKKFHIEHRQDVTKALDLNRKERNEFRSYRESEVGQSKLAKYAHIPDVVIIKWKEELGVDVFNPDHAEAVKKLLNDPEWYYLRTTEGKI